MKKLFLFFAVVFVLSLFPLAAFAADDNSDGYNDHDVTQISAFLSQTSKRTTNAQKLGYADANDPATWTSGIAWTTLEGEKHVQSIDWGYNGLAGDLDVSGCAGLSELYVSCCGLTSLDVGGCTALNTLQCDCNSLSSLDVSSCTALSMLFCGWNSLSSLDVSNCAALSTLNCGGNSLSSLDVSNCTALNMLQCGRNSLGSLDVSGSASLTWLDCTLDKLTELNVSGCTSLTGLMCNYNSLSSLDVIGCPIEYFQCSDNPLRHIHAVIEGQDVTLNASEGYVKLAYLSYDVEGETYLERYSAAAVPENKPFSAWTGTADGESFSASSSNIDLELGRSYDITADFASGTVYNDHDVTKMQAFLNQEPLEGPNYRQLGYDADDPSTWSDITWTPSPEGLRLASIVLNDYQSVGGTLDLSGCTYLESVDFYGNEFTDFNFSGCTSLTDISSRSNFIETLNLSGCNNLVSLKLNNNYGPPMALDLNGYTKLEHLECIDSGIKDLDLGGCTSLTYLDCSNNPDYNNNSITTLDVSDSTGLTTLNCAGNPLKHISAFLNNTVVDLTAEGPGHIEASYNGGEMGSAKAIPDSLPFAGWTGTQDGSPFSSESAMINLALGAAYDLTANFGYTVVYDGNGAAEGVVPDGGRYGGGAVVTVSGNTGSLAKTGYVFAGWNTAADGSGASYIEGATLTMTAGDVTLYAVWEPAVYAITYDLGGGEAENPADYTVQTPGFTLNNPARPGYTFTGWTGTGLTEASMSVTISAGSAGDRSYTANWIRDAYTVTFDSQGGSAVDSMQVNAGEAVGSAPVTTRSGYDFTGWHTEEGTSVEFPYTPAGSVTLYAGWTEQPQTTYLKGVTLSSGTLNKEFSKTVYSYKITPGGGETSFTLTPIKEYEGASMTINGESVSSYTVNLEGCMCKKISVKLTLGDKVTVYTFTVTREACGCETNDY